MSCYLEDIVAEILMIFHHLNATLWWYVPLNCGYETDICCEKQ